jgi:hypothetical protein
LGAIREQQLRARCSELADFHDPAQDEVDVWRAVRLGEQNVSG